MNTPGQTPAPPPAKPAPPPAADGAPDWDAFADFAQRVANLERYSPRRIEITRALERDRRARLEREMQKIKSVSSNYFCPKTDAASCPYGGQPVWWAAPVTAAQRAQVLELRTAAPHPAAPPPHPSATWPTACLLVSGPPLPPCYFFSH